MLAKLVGQRAPIACMTWNAHAACRCALLCFALGEMACAKDVCVAACVHFSPSPGGGVTAGVGCFGNAWSHCTVCTGDAAHWGWHGLGLAPSSFLVVLLSSLRVCGARPASAGQDTRWLVPGVMC